VSRPDPALDLVQRAFADRFTIVALKGRGGMGLVYRARDLRLPRDVALKVLRPELTRTLAARRFTREIEVVARLTHPHIIPVFEAGEAGGLLFFTMPFIEGPTLRSILLDRGPIAVEEACAMTEAIASALGAAHDADIVHRDVKPENVLVASGEPLVADFGVARAVTAASGDRLTTTGFVVGTTQYMSPEQASSDRTIDGRADQYAVACVLYEMLAGAPPFTGGSPRQIIARHIGEVPVALGLVRPDTPAHVSAAVARALAKNPEDRFPDMRAFRAALRAGAPTPLVGVPAVERPGFWQRLFKKP
jgi:eukaryotic-like serine/threonine-protein kinase